MIDALDVAFPEGLVIITGQTGAGKSILLGALSLLSGARADASAIGEGADSCVVEAEFSGADPELVSLLREADVEEDGDLQLIVTIESYDVRAQAVTANEVAAQNRLTITAKATFINVLHPEENFENKQFAAYQDYNSELSLDAVEASLCDDIIETLVEDIFNASVAQW